MGEPISDLGSFNELREVEEAGFLLRPCKPEGLAAESLGIQAFRGRTRIWPSGRVDHHLWWGNVYHDMDVILMPSTCTRSCSFG